MAMLRGLTRSRYAVLLILAIVIYGMTFMVPRVSHTLNCETDSTNLRFTLDKNSGRQSGSEDTTDQHILAPDMYIRSFKVQGHRFHDRGVAMTYEHMLTSSVIHSFSPYTENRIREIMLEPRKEQRIYANSPAIMWHKGELICVMRIWLEKEKYNEGAAKKPPNDFSDNFLYTQRFNRHMRPTTPGSVLGIPTPRQWLVGDGPIEPRLFKTDEENIFISFNTGVYLEDGKALDGTFMWDYLRHKTIIPSIVGGSPIMKTVAEGRMPRDKHWTPYMEDKTLKMVYNLDPLRVLACKANFTCNFTHFEGPQNYQFVQNKDSLRGGTPWVLYKYPYYYSIGHSTLFINPSYDRIYTINIIVYRAGPVPRVVYLSGPLQIHEKPMNDVPIVRFNYIKDPFFFPVSLIEEDGDSIVIGGHINDYSSVLLRVRGVKSLLAQVVQDDKIQPEDMAGPPLGTLHNSTKMFATKATKNQFFTA